MSPTLWSAHGQRFLDISTPPHCFLIHLSLSACARRTIHEHGFGSGRLKLYFVVGRYQFPLAAFVLQVFFVVQPAEYDLQLTFWLSFQFDPEFSRLYNKALLAVEMSFP